jgi:outer membrane biosynthesis protein TonB
MKTQSKALGSLVILALCLPGLAGCGANARSTSAWQDDTQKMLETSNEAITNCYNAALQTNRQLAGSVTVTFTINQRDGHVKKPRVNEARTTGNNALKKCVIDNIQDLKIEPPDDNHGEATYTWVFNASDTKFGPAPVEAAPAS